MGLESGTFIDSLVPTNPVGATDPKSQGDDHLRLIKSTILNSFTGITGAMTLTHTQLNDAAIKGEANSFTLANSFNANVSILNGSDLLITDAGNTDSITMMHDGADFLATFFQTANWDVIGLTGNMVLRDGAGLQINDAGDTDSLLIAHDGTDIIATFTSTADFQLVGLGNALVIRDGAGITINDPTDTDSISLSHDGTNALWTAVNVAAMNFQSINIVTDNDDAQEPGYKGAPQRTVASSESLTLADAGWQIYLTGGSGQTLTIPANGAVAFPIGTIIIVPNDSGNDWTIAITTDTLEKYGGSTGSQTLTDNNKAVIEKVTATLWKYASTD